MVELRELKKEKFAKALVALQEVVNNKEGLKIDAGIIRDSAIQRFKFTAELTWKSLKIYLLEKNGIETNSPKNIYREARKVGLLSTADTELALQMIDDRNRSTHDYSETFSDILFSNISQKYLPLLQKIFDILI